MSIRIPNKTLSLDRWRLPRSFSPDSKPAVVFVDGARKWKRKELSVAVNCAPMQLNPDAHQETDDYSEQEEGVGIMCELCNGRGWLLCDYCKGQKTNVKAENNRIYRRCPNCKAVGYVVCSKCKVFKCVTYPDYSDGEP